MYASVALVPMRYTLSSQARQQHPHQHQHLMTLLRNPQDKKAAISLLSGLVLALVLNRRISSTDVSASLRELADNIDANNISS